MAKVFVPLPVSGPLDTANPITDRPPGTLTVARNVATRWMGPRKGYRKVASPHDYATAAMAPTAAEDLIIFDGVDDEVLGTMEEKAQRDLISNWTLDIVFRLHAEPSGSWHEIFSFGERIRVEISGTGAATSRLIRVSAFPDISTYATGTTQITADTVEQPHSHVHLRVIRNGTSLTAYFNGVSEASRTLSANTNSTSSVNKQWKLCDDQNVNIRIYRVALRTGARANARYGYSDFSFPRAQNVRLFLIPNLESDGSVLDLSRFRAHGTAAGSPSSLGTPLNGAPFRALVQTVANYTDRDGKVWNVVLCGGTLFWSRVT